MHRDDDPHDQNLLNENLRSLYDHWSEDFERQSQEILPFYSRLTPTQSHYVEEEVISRGGMKTISKVFDPKTRRHVARAMLNPKSPVELSEPFLREAYLTALLEHPNIISIYDIGLNEDSAPYFIMELKTGQNLKTLVNQKHDDTSAEPDKLHGLLDIFLKVCDAIEYAHSQNVIHLDLKPENIQVGQYGEVVVCDWGLAKIIGDKEFDGGEFDRLLLNPDLLNNMTLVGNIRGTPGFMAPEQVESDREKTIHTDIYSLGALLYFILTVCPPIHADTVEQAIEKTRAGDISPPDQTFPHKHVPPALNAVVMKALTHAPDQRYPSVKALRNDIQYYLAGFATSAENAGFLRELKLFYCRNRTICNLSLLFLCLFISSIITAFILITQSEKRVRLAHTQLQEEKVLRMQIGQNAAPAYYRQARRAFNQGDLDEAFTNVYTASILSPELEEASNLLALLYFVKGEHVYAHITFTDTLSPFYRKLKTITSLYLQDYYLPEEELKAVEELITYCQSIAPNPEATTIFLYWAADERPMFRDMSFNRFSVDKQDCIRVLTFASQQNEQALREQLVQKVTQTLVKEKDWTHRRRPIALAIKLTSNPKTRQILAEILPQNLAMGQPVVTSGQDTNDPNQLVDGNLSSDSYWATNNFPATITVDLGDVYDITSLKVTFPKTDSEPHQYTLEKSINMDHFTPIVDQTQNKQPQQFTVTHDIQPTSARYVRLTVTRSNHNLGASVCELEVY